MPHTGRFAEGQWEKAGFYATLTLGRRAFVSGLGGRIAPEGEARAEPRTNQMRNIARKLLYTILALAALAALIYRSGGAIHLADFSGARLLRAVAGARISFLLASIGICYVAYALRALRWQRFCRSLGPTTFANTLSAILIGFTAMFVLGRAGEPIPPLLQARKNHLRVAGMFGIYVLERIFDLAGIAVLAGLGLIFSPGRSTGQGDQAWETKMRAAGSTMLLGFIGLVLLVVYFRLHGAGVLDRYLATWQSESNWRRRVASQFGGFSEGLQAIRTFGDLAATVFYSAVHWTLFALVFLLVMHSFGGSLAAIGLAAAILILAFTMIGSTVQLPGVGGGAQVATFIILTRMFRVQQEPAAAAAIVLWLMTFATACLAGVPLLIREGWSIGDLRRLARAETEAEETGTHITEVDGAKPAAAAKQLAQ